MKIELDDYELWVITQVLDKFKTQDKELSLDIDKLFDKIVKERLGTK